MSLRCLFAAAALMVGIAAAPVQAITVWTDESDFIAATGGSPTYGFPASDAEKDIHFIYKRTPLVFGGESLGVLNDDAYGAGVPYLASDSDLAAVFLGGTGIGFHLASYYGAADVDIEINGWYVTTMEFLAAKQTSFIGFTDLDPFLTVIAFHAPCSCGGDEPALEPAPFELDVIDFTTDGTSVVPEPATWALLIAGFAMTGTALRRRRGLATA